MTKEIAWHALSLSEIKKHFSTNFNKGLDENDVIKLQHKYGKNIFEREENNYYIKLFWKQIKSPLVFILIIAGLIALGLKEYTNTIVIFFAVFINTAIGVFQEGKASQALKKIKSSQKKYATVLRDGRQKVIEASELVPGDIIVLKMGDQVPADARLIEEKGVEVNESILTGEWIAVVKDAHTKISENAHITERETMVWMGTMVTEGWAMAIVVKTGFESEIGKIAEIVSRKDLVVTPLQKGIKKLAKFLGIISASALVIIFVLGILRGEHFASMLIISVAVAVAVIPEGLPVAVTVALAIGTERILSKGGLIKNIIASEVLGSTSLILTDKTGTLTMAKMQVSKIMTMLSECKEFEGKEHKDRLQILEMALFTSDAFIENPDEELKEWIIRGRAMDKAILIAAIESGIKPIELLKKHKKIDSIPFDSERRFTSSMYKMENGKTRVFIAGAPELILSFSNKFYQEEKELKLGEKEFKLLNHSYEKETSTGMRVLAIAYRDVDLDSFPHEKEDGVFEKMVFAGFIGFHDPLRDDVIDSIKLAKDAQIKIVMVTGDHITTARKIAEETGILTPKGFVLTGDDVEKMTDKEFLSIIERVDVYARVLPHQKLRIVRLWQSRGYVVAMTGDGVNDAPALKNADIGLALGSGTEVAKEASDMVLLNDSFSVIISAIEEGRRLLDNLKKIIAYLIATSFSEIILVGVAIIAGMHLPILPAQILWANIIGEGFMNFAFVFEPKEKDLMKRDPRTQTADNILSGSLKKLIFTITITTGALLLILFFVLENYGYPIEKLRTIMFAAISIGSIFFAFSLKNLKKPIWEINIFSNLYLVFALVISFILLLLALFVPILQKLLSIIPLSSIELLVIFGVGVFNLLIIETAKYLLFDRA